MAFQAVEINGNACDGRERPSQRLAVRQFLQPEGGTPTCRCFSDLLMVAPSRLREHIRAAVLRTVAAFEVGLDRLGATAAQHLEHPELAACNHTDMLVGIAVDTLGTEHSCFDWRNRQRERIGYPRNITG